MPKPKRHANRIQLLACIFLLTFAVPHGVGAEGPNESFNGGRAFDDLKSPGGVRTAPGGFAGAGGGAALD